MFLWKRYRCKKQEAGGMNTHRIFAIFKTEFLLIRRDLRSLFNTAFLPILLLFLLGYVLSGEVQSLRLVAFDADRTSESRYFLQSLETSSFFEVGPAEDLNQAALKVRRNRADGLILIPEDFTERLLARETVPVEMILNKSHPTTARIYLSYLDALSLAYPVAAVGQSYYLSALSLLGGFEKSIDLSFDTLFNPAYDRYAFIVPALLGCIPMFILPLLSAMSLVKEKETGSLNRLLAAPTAPMEFLLGKLGAHFLIALGNCFLLAAVAFFWFGIPFRGSLAEYTLVVALFVFWNVLSGLAISTLAENQMTALVVGIVVTLLPAFLFSGLFFPVATIPMPVRLVAYLVPAQYFVTIAREMFLKGSGLLDWWPSFAGLCLMGAATFAATYLLVKRRREA
jgi:ABC-2 type transport system permease protein